MISGRLLMLAEIGLMLFVGALLTAFALERVCAAAAVLASLLCLPLYLYLTFPGPGRWLFGGEFHAPLQASVVWETWSVIGILTLILVGRTELRSALRSGPPYE